MQKSILLCRVGGFGAQHHMSEAGLCPPGWHWHLLCTYRHEEAWAHGSRENLNEPLFRRQRYLGRWVSHLVIKIKYKFS